MKKLLNRFNGMQLGYLLHVYSQIDLKRARHLKSDHAVFAGPDSTRTPTLSSL
jgi:hypothetical protein